MKFFSYYKGNNLVNLSNSILKRFGVDTFHESMNDVDVILKDYKKIALFLFDGFGKSVSERHLGKDSYLMKNKFKTISSTFPPTTVAATNALKSGQFPSETGWLGWSFLDKQTNRVIEYFTHRNYATKERCDDYDYSRFNYVSIFNRIKNQNPDMCVFENYPSFIADGGKNGYKDVDHMFRRAKKILKENEDVLIYNYILEPDKSLHDLGVEHKKIREICSEIDYKIEKFAKENPDTLILVFADHSHINVKPIFFAYLTELHNYVTNIYAIEARCASFVIKDNKEKEFINYYENNLKNDYVLLTKREVIELEIFGPTKDTKWLDELLGDYILIATGANTFENFVDDPMIATHAGGTEEENLINLYILNRKGE